MDIKCGLPSKHLFQRIAVVPNHWVSINLHKKTFIEVSCINDIHTWERLLLQLLLLKACETFFLRQSEKVCNIL